MFCRDGTCGMSDHVWNEGFHYLDTKRGMTNDFIISDFNPYSGVDLIAIPDSF